MQLPQEASAYCYISISLLDIRMMYIGQAFSLVNGLYQNMVSSRIMWFDSVKNRSFLLFCGELRESSNNSN
jgi:hypothetical protein